MKIVIVGCSGFIGTQLKQFFEDSGHEVVPLKVRGESSVGVLVDSIQGTDILINLAGLSIFGRWSKSYKEGLYNSRIQTTKKLIDAIEACEHKPKRFISTSAVGIYKNDILCDEKSSELSDAYLGHVCMDWEREALKAEDLGVSTIIFRFGVIVGREGGMIGKMWRPFSLGLGGKIGSGEQSLSWIHIEDLCQAYRMGIDDRSMKGIYNLCSPESTTNIELTKTLGALMHRPTFFNIPTWMLRLALSEGADVMLSGQKAYPKALLEHGFEFKYPTIKEALGSFF